MGVLQEKNLRRVDNSSVFVIIYRRFVTWYESSVFVDKCRHFVLDLPHLRGYNRIIEI